MKAVKPNKGDFPEVKRDGHKLYITWNDKRLVNLLTTVHNGSTFTKVISPGFMRIIIEKCITRKQFSYIQCIWEVLTVLISKCKHVYLNTRC